MSETNIENKIEFDLLVDRLAAYLRSLAHRVKLGEALSTEERRVLLAVMEWDAWEQARKNVLANPLQEKAAQTLASLGMGITLTQAREIVHKAQK